MATFQETVDEIRGYVVAGGRVHADHVALRADEYARACREVNDRLHKCHDALRRGLRSDAIQMAETEPNLLDLVAMLDFPELAIWKTLCHKRGMLAPPEILIEMACALNEAYAAEEPVKALLAVHRMLALAQAPLSERLKVMRRIAQFDPASDFWNEDIHTFEVAEFEMPDAPALPANAACDYTGNHQPERIKSYLFGLAPNVICPHCWHQFPPDEVMWVAAHSLLVGDAVLGPEKPRRFLPTRFNAKGQAIDARGVVCHQLACPRCHLILPRSILESEPLIISIIGGPKTGKSYLLTAMTWELRKLLPLTFALSFNDADPTANQHLTSYEATLFLPEDPGKLVALAKTEESGELYDQANIGGHIVALPRPFVFNIRPNSRHTHAEDAQKISRVICLYDNAGESYQPGRDTMTSPVTQHLTKSKVLMFLFDPTQEPRLREKCRAFSQDPQLTSGRGTQRQETLLNEAASRVRRYANLPPGKKHDRPLLILVPKSDVWGPLLDEDLVTEPILPDGVTGQSSVVDAVRIETVSRKIRALLEQEVPGLVTAAEDFCHHVLYVPVSASGRSPEETALSGGGRGLFIRPKDITPHWASVPVLYMFAKWTTDLISGNAPVTAKRAAGTMVSG